MTPSPIDLSSCDAEPIHVPGAIQPHGVLIAMREPELRIVQASANVCEMLSVEGTPPGRSLAELVGRVACERVARALGADDLALENPLRIDIGGRPFDGVLHRNATAAILELEPSPDAELVVDRLLRDSVIRLQRVRAVAELCAVAARQLRVLTGFDRVMVYRFHGDGHGEVVSEDRAHDVDAFLGLHFPAADIPRQARQLYALIPIRVIPDARYTPVPLVGTEEPGGSGALDLTFAALRGVSPVHLEYLANMGVRASMSVSLMRGDRLWGLLACHHREPRQVPFVVRSACEIIGRLVSLQIDALEEIALRAQRDALRGGESLILEAMRGGPGGWAPGLLARPEALLRGVSATGAALIDEGGVRTAGDVPSIPEIAALGSWLATAGGRVFASHALAREYPASDSYRSVASGLLAVRVAKPHSAYLMWFRQEVLRTATWGGNPAKPVTPESEDGRLHPRQSFAAWKEIVRGTSTPWTPAEIEVAEDVARRAIEVDLEQQITRAEKAVRGRDDVVAVVSHDLKNPVNVIQLATQVLRNQVRDATPTAALATLARIERAAARMTALITNLLDLAKIEAGRFQVVPAPCEARALVDDAISLHEPIADERSVRLESSVEEDVLVFADRDRMFQVLGNLLSNAIKFSPRDGVVRVKTATSDGFTRFEVHDEGPGLAPNLIDHVFDRYWQGTTHRSGQGSGLGLYIARGLVEAHGGRIWVESEVGVGSAFCFTVPSARAA
jgi:chemotaxis family two-component system sensor kinase Cph1